MKNKIMEHGKGYLITTAIGAVLTIWILFARGVFAGYMPAATLMKALSDGFFVPGVLITGVGLLVWVAGEGTFDIMAYGVKLLWDVFRNEWESFHDYKARKGEKGKPAVSFILHVGVLFLLLAGVFTGLFYAF